MPSVVTPLVERQWGAVGLWDPFSGHTHSLGTKERAKLQKKEPAGWVNHNLHRMVSADDAHTRSLTRQEPGSSARRPFTANFFQLQNAPEKRLFRCNLHLKDDPHRAAGPLRRVSPQHDP